MEREIAVALDLNDAGEARLVADVLGALADVRLVGSINGTRPPVAPDVVVTGEAARGAPPLARLGELRRDLPRAQLFFVSRDARPEYVVEVMRAGAAEFLQAPVGPARLAEAVERVRARLLAVAAEEGEGRVVSFVSAKGGIGATVLAVNTAVALARESRARVAFLDLSLHTGDSAVLLDMLPPTTIADVCADVRRLDPSMVREAFSRHESGLWYLPAPRESEAADAITGEQAARVIELARGLFDWVVTDCASMGSEAPSRAAFRLSDRVFVLTDLSLPAVRNAVRLARSVRHLGVPADRVEILLNRYIKGSVPSVEEVEKTLGRKVYWLFPNEFSGVVASINQGRPLVTGAPGGTLARSVRQFVEKLRDPGALGSYRGIRGMFGKAV